MGLDGFSMGNLGMNTEMTAAQVASEAEFLAAKESKPEVKQMSESHEEEGIKRKDEDAENNKKQNKKKSDSNNNDDDDNEFNQSATGITEKDLADGDLKNFSLRLNEITNRIELINNKEKAIVEAIDAEDLRNIMSKLNYASGILVNKKV